MPCASAAACTVPRSCSHGRPSRVADHLAVVPLHPRSGRRAPSPRPPWPRTARPATSGCAGGRGRSLRSSGGEEPVDHAGGARQRRREARHVDDVDPDPDDHRRQPATPRVRMWAWPTPTPRRGPDPRHVAGEAATGRGGRRGDRCARSSRPRRWLAWWHPPDDDFPSTTRRAPCAGPSSSRTPGPGRPAPWWAWCRRTRATTPTTTRAASTSSWRRACTAAGSAARSSRLCATGSSTYAATTSSPSTRRRPTPRRSPATRLRLPAGRHPARARAQHRPQRVARHAAHAVLRVVVRRRHGGLRRRRGPPPRGTVHVEGLVRPRGA